MGEGADYKGVIDVLNQKAYPTPATSSSLEARMSATRATGSPCSYNFV